ncbi:MAG: GIY-YIG nuclease family protein [Chitinophagaceae bacterium]|nr:GIY-YIG nuclease family protein [Chitinophagaceae bacterium]
MYAIVDIETTGGNAGTGSITEIAIIITDGNSILDTYTSLVNPLQPIPLFIEKLTGINDAMVSKAPTFSQIAKDVYELLQDKIFVAHNVNFDYSFVAHQLNQQGYKLNARKLCTVRLSRNAFEDLPSYSLGNLCRSLDIQVKNRHRAMGDAEATTRLFHLIVEADRGLLIKSMLKKGSGDGYLPIHLSSDDLEQMPNTPGIYYFHDEKGKIIYVGKAKRLRKRVISHFSNNDVSKRKQDLMRMVHKISFKETGNELMMSVMESIEIKRIWPLFNRSQKKFENRFGICSYIDQRGVLRLGIVKKKKNHILHTSFSYHLDGIRLLNRLAREHKLCPKMCFLQIETINCVGIEEDFCEGICAHTEDVHQYNKKVTKVISSIQSLNPTLAVFGEGRQPNEKSCVLIGKNDFLATGFIEENLLKKIKLEKLVKKLEPAASNEFIRSMVLNYAELNPTLTKNFD